MQWLDDVWNNTITIHLPINGIHGTSRDVVQSNHSLHTNNTTKKQTHCRPQSACLRKILLIKRANPYNFIVLLILHLTKYLFVFLGTNTLVKSSKIISTTDADFTELSSWPLPSCRSWQHAKAAVYRNSMVYKQPS